MRPAWALPFGLWTPRYVNNLLGNSSFAGVVDPKNQDLQVFRPGTIPPGPRTLKIVKIKPEICLQTNSQPEMPSESIFEGGFLGVGVFV